MVLDRYAYLNAYKVFLKSNLIQPAKETIEVQLTDDTITITLAEISPITSKYVTVHRLSDYRRNACVHLSVPSLGTIMDKFVFNREEVLNKVPLL
ncbi:hypothetical protein [Vallitalea okinawensis]|uniref:hypothetical protein n=1 Tax=Vallitalea okinawensis TaxID=2078660 RepID=UPI000CFDA64F|nr:hypothetical protein [Vallitalea okinawensis]